MCPPPIFLPVDFLARFYTFSPVWRSFLHLFTTLFQFVLFLTAILFFPYFFPTCFLGHVRAVRMFPLAPSHILTLTVTMTEQTRDVLRQPTANSLLWPTPNLGLHSALGWHATCALGQVRSLRDFHNLWILHAFTPPLLRMYLVRFSRALTHYTSTVCFVCFFFFLSLCISTAVFRANCACRFYIFILNLNLVLTSATADTQRCQKHNYGQHPPLSLCYTRLWPVRFHLRNNNNKVLRSPHFHCEFPYVPGIYPPFVNTLQRKGQETDSR